MTGLGTLGLVLIWSNLAYAHMFMGMPKPFLPSDISTSQTFDPTQLVVPLNSEGSQQLPFPCKGHHLQDAAAEPTVTWQAGEQVTIQ